MMKENDKIVMVVTIGTRDITLDGKFFSQIKPDKYADILEPKLFDEDGLTPRDGGEYILNNIDQFAKRLDYPIVRTALEEVISKVKIVHKLYIVSTNQIDQSNIPEKFIKKDTIYFAKILEQLLQRSQKTKKPKPIKYFQLIEIKRHVSQLDEMFKFWGNYFSQKKGKDLRENDRLILLPIGGIDAINTGLLLTGIMVRKEACSQLYFSEKNYIPPIELKFGEQLIKGINKEKVIHSLKIYDYASLENILTSDRNTVKLLVLLTQYAKNRLYFNLDEAKSIAVKIACENRDLGIRLINEIISINDNEEIKIKELLFNAYVKYQQEQYVDFILRIFRVEESIYRYYIEKYLNINTKVGQERFKEFNTQVESFPKLKEYLHGKKFDGESIKFKEPTTVNLRELFAYILDVNESKDGSYIVTPDEKEKLLKIRECTEYLRKLITIRNNCIGAHGFNGVSKKIIEDKLGITIKKLFNLLEECLGVSLAENTYSQINDYILKGY